MGSEDVDMEMGESGTDAAMAERAIKNLHILDNASSEPITIITNNLGGSVFHGMAIYDAIKKYKNSAILASKVIYDDDQLDTDYRLLKFNKNNKVINVKKKFRDNFL
jgi:hypothetical protein